MQQGELEDASRRGPSSAGGDRTRFLEAGSAITSLDGADAGKSATSRFGISPGIDVVFLDPGYTFPKYERTRDAVSRGWTRFHL